MYSGITSGRVLNGELLYTKIPEVNLFAFAYRLFRRDFSPLDGTYCIYIYVYMYSYEHYIMHIYIYIYIYMSVHTLTKNLMDISV